MTVRATDEVCSRSSLADRMLHELGDKPGVPLADVRKICQCVGAHAAELPRC